MKERSFARRTARFFLCCFLLLGALVESLRAESLKISGLSFSVDALVDVDASNVKVTLFGETQIIARTSLEEYVLHKYFANTQAGAAYPYGSLRAFIADSLNQGRSARAAAGLGALCRTNPDKNAEIAEWLGALPESERARDFFAAAVSNVDEKQCTGGAAAELILRAGVSDPEWLKTKGVRATFDQASALRSLAERKIQQSGSQRNFSEMNRYLQFYSTAFGIEDARYLEMKLLYSKATQAVEAVQKGDVQTLYPLIEQTKVDAALSDILSPLLIEGLHTYAAKALSRSEPETALATLAHFDIRKRTPTTHQLIEKALQSLQPSQRPAPSDPATGTLLLTVASSDPQVRAAYLGYLDRLQRYFIVNGFFDEISTYFQILTALRPDPNIENDRLRVEQISAYLDRKMLYSARDKLRQVQTGVPFFAKVRFAMRGLYFDPMYIVIAVVSPLAAGIVIYLVELLARLRRRVANAVRKKATVEAQEEEEIQPAFVKSGLARAMSPSMIEYRECLKVFGLNGDVDLKAIKAAYRHAVKEVHPDLHKGLDRGSSERFLLLTKTYERILELYEQVQTPKLNPPLE